MKNWESKLDREIRFHLEQATLDYIAGGLSEEEARRRARRDFGAVDLAKEECRDTLALRWLRDLWQDLNYAFRSHRKAPGVAAVAIVTLALGIGAATSVFSLVHAVLFRGLPYADAQDLVYVWSPNSDIPSAEAKQLEPSHANYYAWQRLAKSFTDLAMFDKVRMRLTMQNGSPPEQIDAVKVTGNLFRTLGTDAELGRTIAADDDQPGHGDVAVISHTMWQRTFDSAPDVLSKSVHLDGKLYRIIGVMGKAFRYPHAWELGDDTPNARPLRIDAWIPYSLTAAERADTGFGGFLGDGNVIGRLRPGVSMEQAQAEMSLMMKQLVAHREGSGRNSSAFVQSFLITAFGDVKGDMLLLLGAVALVLLLTCGNVANLLLARYSDRTQEMAVRSALGASRSRLVRLIVTEAIALTLAGGAVGTALSFLTVSGMVRLAPHDLPRVAETSVDLPVLLFALGVSLLTGLLCGILSAISASRVGVLAQLQAGGGRTVTTSSRTRHILVTCEVALSMVLVTGAGLLIHSYVRLAAHGPGFNQDVLSTRIILPDDLQVIPLQESEPKARRHASLYRRILQDLYARPEVVAAGIITDLPFGGGGSISTLEIEGFSTKDKLSVHTRSVSPRYFEAMGIAVLAGRTFDEQDYSGRLDVVVASEGFARQYFPGQSPIGKRIRTGETWQRIIGVVRNVSYYALEEQPLGEIYGPLDLIVSQSGVFLTIRGRIPPMKLAPIVRQIVLDKEPGATLEEFQTMQDRTWEAGADRRFQTTIMSGFAIIAFVLAVVGLVGLVAHSVRMRTREIGLRAALGATRRDIFRMIIIQGFRLLAAGTAAGLAGSWALSRFLADWLYGITATDPLTFLGASLLLLSAGLAACAIPGMRAAAIDPAVALRYE
jgi:predicted permease